METIVEHKARVGFEVLVCNYRRTNDQWEIGIVTRVEVDIDENYDYRVSYTVRLHRKSESGGPLKVCVGEDQISL